MSELTTAIASSRVFSVSQRAAFAAVGALALSLVSVNASAQFDAPQVRVDFKDLDLTQAKDTKRLYRRLRLAASDVCVGYPDQRGSLRHTPRSKCEQQALTNAIEAIGHPQLLALYTADPRSKVVQRDTKSQSTG